MRIGGKIKALRKQKGISQKSLAEQSNISYSFLSDIEKERSNPSFDKLQRICSALNVDSSYFLGSTKNEEKGSKTYQDILSYMNEVKTWSENDQLELLHYLKIKSISKQ
ncbi:helix-turn-helix domain-containing protein [Amedibacillus sp. YH-ame10]